MTNYTVDVQVDESFAGRADAERLRRAALAALIQQNADGSELTLVVTDNNTLRELNTRYRGIDEPTDVLSFPDDTRGPFVEATGFPRYLGDVVLSLPLAAQQAEEAGHSLEAELQLLVVHGVLHLLGHDDSAPAARSRMWSAQAEILTALGVRVSLPEW
ncbi:MAG: rRNA maturation RNase YbeY [Anaerolineales bacterium]|nr:rRNA maturation RNase YbeY [Anaerolineales bacterium]